VFIDVKLENIHAATKLGIHLTTAAKLKRDLETLGVFLNSQFFLNKSV